jgi:hypothetical protein
MDTFMLVSFDILALRGDPHLREASALAARALTSSVPPRQSFIVGREVWKPSGIAARKDRCADLPAGWFSQTHRPVPSPQFDPEQ